MKLNRKWLMVLALVMSLAMATTGTLAYLTDRDSEANVFTMGNVEIDLNEEFEQGSELIPGVDIEKEATITNTGKNDAWVWLTVLLPYEMGPYTAPGNMSASNNVVHWNYPAESADSLIIDFNATPVEVDTDGDGETEKYYQTNMLWKDILEVGETTAPMMSKVYMDKHVDIDPEGNLFWVNNGEVTNLNWNINTNGNPVIHVSAYAIQAEGFANVQEAYAAYNAQWGSNGAEYGNTEIVTVSTLAELKAALKEAADAGEAVVIDAQGNDLGDLDEVTFTDGAVIKNATFTGDSSHGSYGNNAYGTVTFVDCTFDSGYAYAAHFDEGDGDLVFKGCTFKGWNSFGNAIDSLTFEDCTFGNNGYFGLVRAYQDATFTNCTFEADFEGADVHQDANDGTVVEFTGCTGISTSNIYFNKGEYEGTKIEGTARDNGAKVILDGVDVTDQLGTW